MPSQGQIPTAADRESQERYRALFTQARYPMALVRMLDDIICEANKAHADLFGYSRDELVGHTAIEMGIWVEPPERERLMRELNDKGFVYEFPMLARIKSGERRQVLITLQTIRLASTPYVAVFVRDMTEPIRTAQALRKSESLLRALLNALPDPVWLKDAQGRFLAVNSAWSSFIGVEPGKAVGRTVGELFPPEIAAQLVRPDDDVIARPQVLHVEEAIPGTDGAIRHFETTKATAFDRGETIGLVGIARDVTLRRQAEQDLAARTQGYEARLRSLTIEASLAEERERRNLAGLLHDDVCQLLAVAGMKLALARQTRPRRKHDELVAEVEDLIARTNRAARSLMLQLSHPALYDLGIAAAAEWLAEDIQRLYGVKVHFVDDALPKPVPLPMRVVLFQCLRELLVNAAKHAGVEKVDVALTTANHKVRVTVSDAGRGFDPETVETRAQRGFGFFSIRTRLTNLGGSMEVESAPGEGTTVTLEIPLGQTEDAGNG